MQVPVCASVLPVHPEKQLLKNLGYYKVYVLLHYNIIMLLVFIITNKALVLFLFQCLMMLQLPFMEDVRQFVFASLPGENKSMQPTGKCAMTYYL